MRTRTIALVAVLIVLALAALRFRAYELVEGIGGTVLWDDNEAYIFVATRHLGHNVAWLRLPWYLAKGYLGAVEYPDDDAGSLDVIKASSSGIEHHVLRIEYQPPGSEPELYTPLEDQIYANYPRLGGLCRWAGDHFEPATPDERRRLDDIKYLTGQNIERNKNGWSRRSFQVGFGDSDDAFSVDVGSICRLFLIDRHAAVSGDRLFTIELLRAGHSRERIWETNVHSRMVTKGEYHRVFKSLSFDRFGR